MIRTLAPEIAAAEPGKLGAAKLSKLETVIRVGEEKSPGMFNFADVIAMGGPREGPGSIAISAQLNPGDAVNISSPRAPPARRRARRSPTTTSSTTPISSPPRCSFTREDRLCIPVPFYHCFGMVMGTLGCVTKGAAMVFPGEGFDPGATLTAMAAERCTALYGVPTMFVALLGHPDFKSSI